MSDAHNTGEPIVPRQKIVALIFLGLAQVMTLALWFSASAILPGLRAEFALSDTQASLYTSMVSVGFVLGTLISAALTLSDRIAPARLFSLCAFAAAGANGLILLVDPTSWLVVGLRLVTGMAMAGIYPVGMKIASSWARGDTGFLVGLLVGALTLGSAMPHLFNVLGGVEWRFTLIVASLSAVGGGLLIRVTQIGPNLAPAAPFNPRAALKAWSDRPLRLANFGYLGHMWELYAMWAWIGVFLLHSFTESGLEAPAFWAGAATFAVIASGGLGSLFGGLFADRMGRTTLTIGALTISGACALGVGFFYGGSPLVMVAICLVWGVSVVADSAQFSSCVIELSDRAYLGTMVTVQTCVGFLLTLATIHLVPVMADYVGWQWAFTVLALGPLFGVIAMARLRRHPASLKLASGAR